MLIEIISRFLSGDIEKHCACCTVYKCITIKTKPFQIIRKITQIKQHNHSKEKVKHNIAKAKNLKR